MQCAKHCLYRDAANENYRKVEVLTTIMCAYQFNCAALDYYPIEETTYLEGSNLQYKEVL